MELNLTDEDIVGDSQGGGSMRSGGHGAVEGYGLTPERAKLLRDIYAEELAGRCTGGACDEKGKAKAVNWDEFVKYADEKEKGVLF